MIRPSSGERSWYVSSPFYRFAGTAASDQADSDLMDHISSRLGGAVVLDCGAGPGQLSEKLLRHSPECVIAVDANPLMVAQARRRLRSAMDRGQAHVIQAYVDENFFARLHSAPDICVFKRSLYAVETEAIATVRAAVVALRPGGVIAIVHPERSIRRYVLGNPARFRRYSLFHLFNRLVSRLAVWLRVTSSYRTYRSSELLELMTLAAPDHPVTAISSSQASYTIALLNKADTEDGAVGDLAETSGDRR